MDYHGITEDRNGGIVMLTNDTPSPMKRITFAIVSSAFAIWSHNAPAVAANTPHTQMPLTNGWRITQDVRQLGE